MGDVVVLGAGLAGCEAALQLSSAGANVTLYDMKPGRTTRAHRMNTFGELVCSNCIARLGVGQADEVLLDELAALGSWVVRIASACRMATSGSFCVDTQMFSQKITERIASDANIAVIEEEVDDLPRDRPLVLATGPLTSSRLVGAIEERVGLRAFSFYDATGPVVDVDTIDRDTLKLASSVENAIGDEYSIALDEKQYRTVLDRLLSAKQVPFGEIDRFELFEQCMPIEVLAEIDLHALKIDRFFGNEATQLSAGSIGLVKLRREVRGGRGFQVVGFQTRLKKKDQVDVIRSIPGLESARILRFGRMHRNTYLSAGGILTESMSIEGHEGLHVIGQLAGADGYLAAAATGMLAAIGLERGELQDQSLRLPADTMVGGLVRYLTARRANPQPIKASLDLMNEYGEWNVDSWGQLRKESARRIKQWAMGHN